MVAQPPSTPPSSFSEPKTFWDALELYKLELEATYSPKQAEVIFNLLMTAITRYTLPGWGYPLASGRKPTAAEKSAAQQALQSLEISQLEDARNAQYRAFEQLQATKDQKYTYGSKLENFLTWAQRQAWSPHHKLKQLTTSHRAPKKNHGHQTADKKRLTTRTKLADYSLKEQELLPSLKLELEGVYKYRIAIRYPGRNEGAVKPGTAQGNVRYLREILGIIHSHLKPLRDCQGKIIGYENKGSGVPREQLSLDLIVPRPVVELKQPYELQQPDGVESVTQWHYSAKEVAHYVDSLICCVLNFLENERHSQSYKTLLHPLAAILILVRFRYHEQSEHPYYNDIPAMQVVRKHRQKTLLRKYNHKSVANEDMKWLDLPDVYKQIVNPLRDECEYRSMRGSIRSIKTIAHSFTKFIVWGLLTYNPPRRQQEYRNLKLAPTCPVQRPKGVAPNQLIHPLPENRREEQEIYHGYLYKDRDGIWYKDMTKESYKTGKAYGDQKLPVPNPKFADGKCFYDYLEAYLYGYYRDLNGNWQSSGQLSDTPRYQATWYSLRMSLFEPSTKTTSPPTSHNYVFVMPKTGGFYDVGCFAKLIQFSANRLSGKCLTPHFLRDIYTTWFLSGGYREVGLQADASFSEIIAALAYAMATSQQMLLQAYDCRKPKDKRKPVDQLMLQLVARFTQ
jgi:hypothetical protein